MDAALLLLLRFRRDKGAGHLITFAQFAFITAEGFVQSVTPRSLRTWSFMLLLSTPLLTCVCCCPLLLGADNSTSAPFVLLLVRFH